MRPLWRATVWAASVAAARLQLGSHATGSSQAPQLCASLRLRLGGLAGRAGNVGQLSHQGVHAAKAIGGLRPLGLEYQLVVGLHSDAAARVLHEEHEPLGVGELVLAEGYDGPLGPGI